MPWTKHPRELTKEQFSEGTTIDGNRLDAAVEDVVDNYNQVTPRHLKSRWVPNSYVMGWSPEDPRYTAPSGASKGGVRTVLPWMPYMNNSNSLNANSSAPEEYENEYRMKGNIPPQWTTDDFYGNSAADSWTLLWVWTSSFYFSTPTIIERIFLGMYQDNPTYVAANAFTRWTLDPLTTGSGYDYGAGTKPRGIQTDDKDRSMTLHLSIDDAFNTEDRQQNSVLAIKRDFRVDFESLTQLALSVNSGGQPTGKDLITANYPGGSPHGLAIDMKDMNIPIPAGSRVRFHVCIPRPAGISLDTGWGDYPWFQQYYSSLMVVKEELQSG